jgi:hypothetical protein
VSVSVGELLDKYSILDIKLEMIQDEKKRIEIVKELAALETQAKEYIDTYVSSEYMMLKYVNKMIWILNEKACNQLSFDGMLIMQWNNARFRVKNEINILCNSVLKEVKSYNNSVIKLSFAYVPTLKDAMVAIIWNLMFYDSLDIVLPDNLTPYIKNILEYTSDRRIKISDKVTEEYKLYNISLIPTEFRNIFINHDFN